MMTLTISATAFEAKCLDLLDQVSHGDGDEMEITKHGRVVARLLPPIATASNDAGWHGFMRGTVTIPDGFHLTGPLLGQVWDAESGIPTR